MLVVVDFLVKVVALGLVPERRRPSSAWGWLLLIFFLPFVGIVAFLLIGSPFVDSRRRREQAEVDLVIRERSRDLPDALPEGEVRAWLRPALSLGRALGSLPAVAGNDVRLVTGYDDAIRQLTEAVDEAREYVNVEFYILGVGRDDGAVLGRGDPRHRARGDGAAAVRPHRHPAGRWLPRAAPPAGLHGGRVARDAADPPPARTLAPARPAQPPQDRGRGRRPGVHRVAEPDRRRLPPARRPAVDRADGARARPGGALAQRGVRHRLVRRDPRAARPPVRPARGGPAHR